MFRFPRSSTSNLFPWANWLQVLPSLPPIPSPTFFIYPIPLPPHPPNQILVLWLDNLTLYSSLPICFTASFSLSLTCLLYFYLRPLPLPVLFWVLAKGSLGKREKLALCSQFQWPAQNREQQLHGKSSFAPVAWSKSCSVGTVCM